MRTNKTKNLPTIKDLEFGKIAGRIYSEHRGEIMRGLFTKTFAEKIAIALKQFRADNKRKARASKFENWPTEFAKHRLSDTFKK